MPVAIPTLVGFNNSYIPEPNSGCWLWEKALNNKGYGLLQCGGYKGYAHRFSYAQFKGEIPQGKFVCHQCDIPCCVNPDHLWLGTQLDNMRDCKSKGRHASDSPTTNYASGERAGNSKLDWESVKEIRARGTPGRISHRTIAKDFGVSTGTVSQIIAGKIWKTDSCATSGNDNHLDVPSVYWTAEQDATLRKMLADKISYPVIGSVVGKSKGAISIRAMRLGIRPVARQRMLTPKQKELAR